MYAARDNELGCMHSLLDARCNVDQKNSSFETALHWAVRNANHEAVALLLAAGASASARGWKGRTPLHFLAHCEASTDIDRIQRTFDLLRVAKNANLKARDDDSLTPAMYTLSKNNLVTFRLLVEAGANVHAVSDYTQNVLHLAAECCDTQTLRYLHGLELRGIGVECRDGDGDTPKAAFLFCETASLWNLGAWRRPSRAERRAFGELCMGIRDRNLHDDIRISTLAIEKLREFDAGGARAQLSIIVNQKTEWQQHNTVSWYRGIDKMIQGGDFDAVIEALVEDVEDMLATIGTPFWDMDDDDASSDSSETEDYVLLEANYLESDNEGSGREDAQENMVACA